MDKKSKWDYLKSKFLYHVETINKHLCLKKQNHDMLYIWSFIDGNASITMT